MKAFGHWCWRNFSSTRHQLLRSVASIFKFTKDHSLWIVLLDPNGSLTFPNGLTRAICLVNWLARLQSPMSRDSLGQVFAVHFLHLSGLKLFHQTSPYVITCSLLMTMVHLHIMTFYLFSICFWTGVFRRSCSSVRAVTDTITYSLFRGMWILQNFT